MNAPTLELSPFGAHRVLEPSGALPQPAWKLDNSPVCRDSEILCDVDVLNLDSASFAQIAQAEGNDASAVAAHVLRTVEQRGKQHNPVTGSGGMFIGTVREIGGRLQGRIDAQPGDRIASLVSLSLTPLHLSSVERVDLHTGRLQVRGSAILFESGTFARLPADIDEQVALAALDVAGAPAQIDRLVRPGMTVAIFGCDGKSGLLAAAAARDRLGESGTIVGITPAPDSAGSRLLLEQGYADRIVAGDARDTLATVQGLRSALPAGADLVVNCVNVPGTELSSILSTKDGGTVYFFSMNTSFTAAALGAEGVGKDVSMLIGNGYAKGHAAFTFALLRNHAPLLAYFSQGYASPEGWSVA